MSSALIGTLLGSYRVVEPIGKGGMASVYLGEHTTLGHRVAIKVLHHAGKPIAERRFLDEAKAIAAVRHPGIVQLFDYGRSPDGRAYIVMELLEGETLRSRLRTGSLSLEQALVFGRQIASAVGAAHDVAIVHRDLKPDNIFLIPDPEVRCGERIRVLDFGVAKNLNISRDPSEMTATGVLVGTPAYMSPEQCRGDTSIDHRSDIYSFGVVLYRMLTGELPYESAATGELIGKHLFEEIPDPANLSPGVTPRASAIVARCLAKEPGERYSTMTAVAEDLHLAAEEVYGRRRRSTGVSVASERVKSEFPVADIPDGDPRPTRFFMVDGIDERSPARWLWPLSLGGAVAVGVFVALVIARSGDIPIARQAPEVEATELPRADPLPEVAQELAKPTQPVPEQDPGAAPPVEKPSGPVAVADDESEESPAANEPSSDDPAGEVADEPAGNDDADEDSIVADETTEAVEDGARTGESADEVARAAPSGAGSGDQQRPATKRTIRRRGDGAKSRGGKSSAGKKDDSGKKPESIKVPTLF